MHVKNLRNFRLALTILTLGSVFTAVVAQVKRTPNTLASDSKDAQPKAKIGDVAWIAGHWIGDGLGGACEEVWSPPINDTMMGMFRLVKDGKIVFMELCTIAEEQDALVLKVKHFDADLKSWEEKDDCQKFPLVKLGTNEVYFEGVTFRKLPDGNLQVFVAIHNKKTGEFKEKELSYRPLKQK